MKRLRMVIALGGNALNSSGGDGTIDEQKENMENAAKEIASLARSGHEIVLTHGNGPQVGAILIQQEKGSHVVPKMPLDACVAMTQGEIGYIIQQSILNALGKGINVVSLTTQVLVDKNDNAFKYPAKPIGPFFPDEKSLEGKNYIKVPGKGYRHIVASPKPIEIVEKDIILSLIGNKALVIACGGGGIPVILNDGKLEGIEAVIDKDHTGALLAESVKADIFIILTDVDAAYIDYGKESRKRLSKITPNEAEKYIQEGQFPQGSMGPKIAAAIKFAKESGKVSAIGHIKELNEIAKGLKGTFIGG